MLKCYIVSTVKVYKMIQTSIKKLLASQGVREVLEMIKLNYLASHGRKAFTLA